MTRCMSVREDERTSGGGMRGEEEQHHLGPKIPGAGVEIGWEGRSV